MSRRATQSRETTSNIGLRLLFAAYAGVVAVNGVSWIHGTAVSRENACNTGLTQGDIGGAIGLAVIVAVALLSSGYLVARPPRRWWSLLLAVVALAAVAAVGIVYTGLANLDWCGWSPS